MQPRNHHQQRAVQESRMKAAATGNRTQIHEAMLRYHLERCRAQTDGDAPCAACAVASACNRHHAALAAGHVISVVEIVERHASLD